MSVAAHSESLPGNTHRGGVDGSSWLLGHSVSHRYHLIQQKSHPIVRGSQCLISNQSADELQSQLQPVGQREGQHQLQTVGQREGQHQLEDSEDSKTPHAVTLGKVWQRRI